jgi:hypothetical protein
MASTRTKAPTRSSVLFVATGCLVASGAIAGPANVSSPSSSAPDAGGPGPFDACPKGMIEVKGEYCPEFDHWCLHWMPSEPGAERCAEFGRSGACRSPTVKKHFCIDKYEYPNKVGERPLVMKSWTEGQDLCKAAGKRLCGDSEWTLACEGKRRYAYPYGNKRDSHACNIDKALPAVDQFALADPRRAAAEAARLWQGEPSGSRPGCVSPYGIADMTGNVDEWVLNESGKPFKSGLKGGYWGPVRARCRPMTTTHGETFPFYQTGFRCCADAL